MSSSAKRESPFDGTDILVLHTKTLRAIRKPTPGLTSSFELLGDVSHAEKSVDPLNNSHSLNNSNISNISKGGSPTLVKLKAEDDSLLFILFMKKKIYQSCP